MASFAVHRPTSASRPSASRSSATSTSPTSTRWRWEFFGSDVAKRAVRAKVESLFPEHEHEKFTEHFWGLMQFWRKTEADRLGADS